jgi:signal transducing adaptor molecule
MKFSREGNLIDISSLLLLIQDLYQSSLSMRPKIVKLIDRYNIKVNELRSMNEKFVRARSTFDVMMEQSLAKYNPSVHREDYTNARPEYNYAAPPGGYQASPQQQQQAPPQAQGMEASQQQQEHAQAWANYYAQQGYQQAQGDASTPGPTASSQTSLSAAPPHINDPAYAQWYYSQQQQQQMQSQPQQATPSSAPPAASTTPSGYDYRQGPPDEGNSLHDQDKRAMFERARAEAEAYHRAHQQHTSGSSNNEVHLQ